jgi:hypothetical protein
MSRIYEALKKAEELRAAVQGSQVEPRVNLADGMPNFRINPLLYDCSGAVRGTAELGKA